MVYVCLDWFMCLCWIFVLGCVYVQDPSLLEGRVTLHQVKAGSIVARQGDQVRHHTENEYEMAKTQWAEWLFAANICSQKTC